MLMENRNGLVVETRLTPATSKAERQAALDMVGSTGGRFASHRGRRQGL